MNDPVPNQGSEADSRFDFDRETASTPIGPGLRSGLIRPDWNIGDNPNGGYALASVLRAVRSELGDEWPDPIAVNTHFLRPALAGREAEFRVETVRTGRRTATVRGALVQDGKERVETIATFGRLSSDDPRPASTGDDPGALSDVTPEVPELPGPDECVGRSTLAQGVSLPLMSRVEVRIVPEYSEPGTADHAATAGWIRFADGREPDPLSLPLFADCFPPTAFSLFGRIGWVPTIELTVHVRARPRPGWLKATFSTTDVANGFLVEDGRLWDSSDTLVAQSRQLALVTTA